MEPVSHYAKKQYELVQESRRVLFDYCKTISPVDLLNENSSFGRGGSIRNLLVHIANTYQFWIAKWGLDKNIVFTPYDANQSMSDIVDLFAGVDLFMHEFINSFDISGEKQINFEINGVKNSASQFKLFTHVITHEFHHKGQVLSLSRHLGYTPIDTDVVR